jgi:benzoyl-CoA reductase/2-hydroxyglutaryl-CoA dehydratase subunit BcrC/BadD/HgdB
MSAGAGVRYRWMRDVALPAVMAVRNGRRKGKRRPSDPLFGPPLLSTRKLRRLMTRHYALARYAEGAMPVAWVTSGAPVELLRAFGCYTVYPENHGALCGARHLGPELCAEAEAAGFSQDLCSYARIDLGHALSGKTPVGKLPKPDVLFCTNNICQTILYWFKEMAHRYGIPLVVLDTPFISNEDGAAPLAYVADQMRAMVPILERHTRRCFQERRFHEVLLSSKRCSELWGSVLATMRHRPAPMTIFDAFVHLAPVVSLRGLPACERYYEGLLKELEGRIEAGVAAVPGERHRLMWDNIAIWFALKPLSRLFAENGCVGVAGTYTNAWAETTYHLDPADPFGSLAKAYTLIFLNRSLKYRLELMEGIARDYQVDGLVLHSARSCKPYSVGQYDLRKALSERLGIKTVLLEADMTDFRSWSEEQATTRLTAFFESLEAP